ncbi:uncharacterized protein LOC114975008 [Acropora millepora]|uniref:uncharacterized protein LOC114975008 n=1 Tax=Acropora millepora TaxID=45264 RepID=UPI001CF310A3|nr:uncharacterized protein LOC114975008 [Acropora millepora]
MLLENVTSSISGDPLQKKTPVVCVAWINRNDRTVRYQCCDVHKEVTEPAATLRCNQSVDEGDWSTIVFSIFLFLSYVLTSYAPALPLALPDYVFSLKDEIEKENRLAVQTDRETTGNELIPATEGEQYNQMESEADRENADNVALYSLTTNNTSTAAAAASTNTTTTDNTNREETGQNTSNCETNSERREESELLPVDDSSPMNISTLLRYIILGLTLNTSILTPFLVFFFALISNLYLCYENLKNKYKDVKKIISERREKLHVIRNAPEGTISAKLYWFVCERVLPHEYEFLRMLRNMVFVSVYLFLALSSIVFFGNKYDISTFTLTISVLFTGSIPSVFLKSPITNSNVIGWAKIKMVREIDQAIKEYRDNSNGEAVEQQILEAHL